MIFNKKAANAVNRHISINKKAAFEEKPLSVLKKSKIDLL